MMASDIHHRTEEFRNVYRSALADLKEVYGTTNDVLCFAASGTGAMDASVSNLFSRGDKAIVCTAGKFGERWVDIAKAYGLDATVLKAEYGEVVTPDRVEAALKAASLRVETDARNEKMNSKIRDFALQKTPYILVFGDKEESAGAVNVRTRGKTEQVSMPLADFIAKANELVNTRSTNL